MRSAADGGWVLAVADPLAALQAPRAGWRRELGARVIGITGSVGKTSVKDIARALLPGRVHASPENFNTEIGLPLTVLGAPAAPRSWCSRWRCAGAGQIAELAEIAEPDVGVITNVGPVHIELLGSIEAIAAAKAEILGGAAGGRGRGGAGRRRPARTPPGRGAAPDPLRRGRRCRAARGPGREGVDRGADRRPRRAAALRVPVHRGPQPQQRPGGDRRRGRARGAARRALAARRGHRLLPLRGERLELGDGIILVNDCYNANPVSMRAALDHLATLEGRAARSRCSA